MGINLRLLAIGFIASLLSCGAFAFAQAPADTTVHAVQMVTVDKDVQLEVVDWGGTGRPLVFLAGNGNTAHNFDNFAPLFKDRFHVYGITRRGFGASSKPVPKDGNYGAIRLGDDVIAVIDALHLDRPVLVGHSMAGEEMSSVASRHPEKVAGLIYLDAAYGFAFFDPAHPFLEVAMNDVKQRIERIEAGGVDEKQALLDLETAVNQFAKTLHESNVGIATMPPIPPRSAMSAAINYDVEKFTSIPVPVLAIYACPHNWDGFFRGQPELKAQREAADVAMCTAQAKAFEAGVPTARVVRIANADHYVFNSNRAQVVEEMNRFLAGVH
jgi:pimeloyl-ACP methyl ester carboxylesterase